VSKVTPQFDIEVSKKDIPIVQKYYSILLDEKSVRMLQRVLLVAKLSTKLEDEDTFCAELGGYLSSIRGVD